jgi:hypothetical protein
MEVVMNKFLKVTAMFLSLLTGIVSIPVSAEPGFRTKSMFAHSHSVTLILQGNGTVLERISKYDPKTKETETTVNLLEDWTDIVQVSNGQFYYTGVKRDGSVLVRRRESDHIPKDEERYLAVGDEVKSWTDIVQICQLEDSLSFLGLKKDGTIVTTIRDVPGEYISENFREVKDWTDIAQIHASDFMVTGVRKDGTVITIKMPEFLAMWGQDDGFFTDVNEFYDEINSWTDIVQVLDTGDSFSDGYGGNSSGLILGLKSDGTVNFFKYCALGAVGVSLQYDFEAISKWTDIVYICDDYGYVVGLKSDGTVVAALNGSSGPISFDWLSSWTDVIAVSTAAGIFGVKKDGTTLGLEGIPEKIIIEPEPVEPKLGDLDSSETVDAADLVILAKHLINDEAIADDRLYIADVNRDGEVTVKDLMLVVLFVSGKIPVLG